MERHKQPGNENYADDRFLNAKVVDELNRCLGGAPLHQADFFVQDAWSCVKISSKPGFNIARGLPIEVTKSLAEDRAKDVARQLPGSEWCSILRNSMAHGGIAYLAADGHSKPDEPAAFYAFVSARYNKEDARHENPTGFKVLRISISDYRKFLEEWVLWLEGSGVADAAEKAEAA